MENINEIIEKYTVRIAINNGEKLKGTGVLYVPQDEKNAMVFTAAHVIRAIFKDNEPVELYMSCSDSNNIYKTVKVKSKITESKSIIDGDVYPILIHPEYDDRELLNDAAIIFIPYYEWMNNAGNYSIGTKKVADSQIGWGFPESTNSEWKKGSQSELAGKKMISGTVGVKEDKRYVLSYSMNLLERKMTRKDIMEGYSGCGLFSNTEYGLTLSGVISKEYGAETSGMMLWASSANLFIDIMSGYDINVDFPDSFQNYIEPVLKTFLKRRQGAKSYFYDVAELLIHRDKLSPEMVIKESSEFYDKLSCERNRRGCNFYWEGQLKKAVYLYGSIEAKSMATPILQMPAPYLEDTVRMEFICTEQSADDIICELIQKDYFTAEGKLDDGTIIILNGKGGSLSLNEMIPRGECRNIIVDISKDYLSSMEYNKKFSKLIATKSKTKFDIVRGNISECNIAVVGIDTLMRPISQGNGEPDNVKKEIEGDLLKIWAI